MEKVLIYTLSTCPWCRKTKQFFTDKKIPFDFIEYDLADENEQERIKSEMSKYGGSIAFPFVIIGEEAVVGYNPKKYEELLGL